MSNKLPGMPAVRDLFREESSGKIFRIIYTKRRGASDWNETEVVLCNIFGSHLDIEFVSLHQFYTRCMPEYEGEGRLTYVKPADDPYGRLRKIHWDTPANEEKSIENWKRIEGLVDDEELFYRTLSSGTDRKNILQDFADNAGVSLQRIRRLHRLYLQRGMNRNAVAGELWRCGRLNQPPRYVDGENAEPTVAARKYKKRPGRKPSRLGQHAVRTEALERLFEQYIDIYITSNLGPWELDVSDELMSEIRRFNSEAIFPSTKRRRKKKTAKSKKKRWPKPSGKQAGKRRRSVWQDMVDHLNWVSRCIRMVRDKNGQVIELELAPFGIVSRRQLTYYYKTRVPIEVRNIRSLGPKKYAAQHRPIRGHGLQHSLGPGMQYMIDATIADMYLVLAYDRTVVVGRPTVYLAMDLWSRMIVGFHVSFDPPSFDSVALMLENIATPKIELCARYGIQIDRNIWPCEYLPSSDFVADRGSDYMKSAAWREVNQSLSVAISNAKAWDPTLRAFMERRFGILPALFQRASFGVVEADSAARGAPNYLWDARLTITEFVKRMIRAILRYNQTPIGRHNAMPELVAAGLANTPLNLWNWGIDNVTGSLRRHSIDEIRCATWPTEPAKPTRSGLEWRGMYYTSPFVDSNLVHCGARGGAKDVPIRFNPNDPTQILLPGEHGLEYGQPAKANKRDPSGWTLMEWEIFNYQQRRLDAEQHVAMESQRVMDLLNNTEESRAADVEQKAALKMAGLAHPAALPRSAVNKSAISEKTDAAGFGKFKIAKGNTAKGVRDQEMRNNGARSDIEEQEAILQAASEKSRRAIDGE